MIFLTIYILLRKLKVTIAAGLALVTYLKYE